MREIQTSVLAHTVKNLCIESNMRLCPDVIERIRKCLESEESDIGRQALGTILENIEVARTDNVPLCQDTGFAVVFVEIGQDVHVVGGDFQETVQEGVRRGYTEGLLRKSVMSDPLVRANTGDNTPAVVWTEIVPGDRIRIVVAPKGGGSENMSGIRMLAPSAGIEGVKDFVVERVRQSGANPCPPVVVGVGIGGTFEKCAYLAKKALLRPLDRPHPDPRYAELERDLLEKINGLGIGPGGFGGRCTALAVRVEVHPCHMASLPVAVNMQCHVARHAETIL